MVIKRGPFSKVDKVAMWALVTVCGVVGSVGMAMAVARAHWRLGLVSAGALGVGAIFGIAAARGRPLGYSSPRRIPQKQQREISSMASAPRCRAARERDRSVGKMNMEKRHG